MKSIRDCGRQNGRRRSEVNQTGRLHKVSSFIMEEQDGTEQGEERKQYEEQRGLWFCLVWSVYLKVSPVFVPALKDKVRRFSSHSKASKVPPKKKTPGIFRGSGVLSSPANFLECILIEFIFAALTLFCFILQYIRHCFTTQSPHEALRKNKMTCHVRAEAMRLILCTLAIFTQQMHNILDPTESKWSQVGMQNGAGDFHVFQISRQFLSLKMMPFFTWWGNLSVSC